MKWKYIIEVSLLIIMMILPGACERDEFSWGKKIGNITYSGNVVFLGSQELAMLKEVSSNAIVFLGKEGEINNIKEKSILVMGVSEKTPYGLLRKVSSLSVNGTDFVVSTTNAFLDDAVKEGVIKLQAKLLEKDFKLKSNVEGVLVKGPDKSFDGLAVTVDNLEVYNDGVNKASLNGAIGISPELDLTIEISNNKLKGISVITTLNKIDELTVDSKTGFSGEKEIVAAEFIHSPINVDSLIFVPEVNIICGFSGTALSEVKSGVRQDRTITSKMNYVNSRWFADPLTHSETFDFIKPEVMDNSNLEIFSGPDITILLFGIPIQVVRATGFYSLEADRTSAPFWKLFIGNEGQNVVKRNILQLDEDYIQNMKIDMVEILNANNK